MTTTVKWSNLLQGWVAECANCGADLYQRTTVSPWFHAVSTEDGPQFIRGCRAATYEEGVGWNDAIDRRLMAKPR